MQYVITVHMPGYLSESDAEPFEATPSEAIDALLDEADMQLGEDGDWDDESWNSDLAMLESLRGFIGRNDLLFSLENQDSAVIVLESYANGFGGYVTLQLVTDGM